MLKKLGGALLIVALVLVAGAYLMPRTAHVERSVFVARPPSVVYALVNSYRRFDDWSPWAELDPALQRTLSGPAEGVGARYEWSGNDKVGSGHQEIVESVPDQRVRTALAFGGEGPAEAAFLLAREGQGTRLTWTLDSDMGNNPIGRWVGLALDKMVGADYERGLARLKTLAETLPDVDLAGFTATRVEVAAQPLVVLATRAAPNDEAIGKAYADAYATIGKALAKHKLQMAGAPLGIESTAPGRDEVAFEAAIPVDRGDVAVEPPLVARAGYAGPALQTVHVGAYSGLGATIAKLQAYAQLHGIATEGPVVNRYVDDPGKVPPASLRTEIYLPVKP